MVEGEPAHLHNRILFSDESLLTQDEIFSSRNEHLWAEDRQNCNTDLQFMFGVVF